MTKLRCFGSEQHPQDKELFITLESIGSGGVGVRLVGKRGAFHYHSLLFTLQIDPKTDKLTFTRAPNVNRELVEVIGVSDYIRERAAK